MTAEQMRRKAAGPLVEISKNDARPMQPLIAQDLWVHQLSPLLPPFEKTRPEVDIKNMESSLLAQYRRASSHVVRVRGSYCRSSGWNATEND